MKKFVLGCLAALSVLTLPTAAIAGAQQDKMKACNAQAKEKALSGEERKAFMKDCLSTKVDARAAQQDKMKACNKEATDKGLKGDDRRTFMSGCLKG